MSPPCPRATFESALDDAASTFPDHPRLRPALAACWQLESGLKALIKAVCKGEHTNVTTAWKHIHDGEDAARHLRQLVSEVELDRGAVEVLTAAGSELGAHAESAAIVVRVLLGDEPFVREVVNG